MADTAVVTLAIGDPDYMDVSIPFMRDYARKTGSDFVILRDRKFPTHCVYAEKLQVRDLPHERILYLDGDIIVRKYTPNLFDIVDPGKIGMCVDGGMAIPNVRSHMDSDMVTLCGHAVKDYCNAGMFLLSHSHKKLLHLAPNLMRQMDKLWYHDQSLFNHIFRPYLQILDDNYNRIMLSDDSDGGAFILHFTGGSKKKMKDYSGRGSLTYKYKLGGR